MILQWDELVYTIRSNLWPVGTLSSKSNCRFHKNRSFEHHCCCHFSSHLSLRSKKEKKCQKLVGFNLILSINMLIIIIMNFVNTYLVQIQTSREWCHKWLWSHNWHLDEISSMAPSACNNYSNNQTKNGCIAGWKYKVDHTLFLELP